MILEKTKEIIDLFKNKYGTKTEFYVEDNKDGTNTIKVFYDGIVEEYTIDDSIQNVDDFVTTIYNNELVVKGLIDNVSVALDSEYEALDIYNNAINKVKELDKDNRYESLVKLFEIILEDEKEHISLLDSYLYNEL